MTDFWEKYDHSSLETDVMFPNQPVKPPGCFIPKSICLIPNLLGLTQKHKKYLCVEHRMLASLAYNAPRKQFFILLEEEGATV